MTLTGFVYLIHNTLSNKAYVGQTTKNPPEQRWNQHRRQSENKHLRHAIKKYGDSVFEFLILDKIESSTLIDLKQILTIYENGWIQSMKLAGLPLYNLREAAESNKGLKYSEESKLLMSRVKIGKPSGRAGSRWTEEQKLRVQGKPSPTKGRVMSEDQKLKISESKRGKANPHGPSPIKGRKLLVIDGKRHYIPKEVA
jgi:group I intron endonuclease